MNEKTDKIELTTFDYACILIVPLAVLAVSAMMIPPAIQAGASYLVAGDAIAIAYVIRRVVRCLTGEDEFLS